VRYDDVPVPIALLERVGRACRISVFRRRVLRLVGIVPISARQPDFGAVAHGDLDVIRRRKHPFVDLGTRPDRRPCECQRFIELVLQVLNRLIISLVGGRIAGRMVQHQRQVPGPCRRGQCTFEAGQNVGRGEIVKFRP